MVSVVSLKLSSQTINNNYFDLEGQFGLNLVPNLKISEIKIAIFSQK